MFTANKEEKRQLLIILLIVFIAFIGTSISYPIFPPLFLHPSDNGIVPTLWSEKTRSILLGIALAAYPLGQFIGSPILGGCSDSYGRKPILIMTLIGSIIGYLLSALALYFHWLSALILSRFLTGLMEGNLPIVRAMATDLKSISKFTSLGRINSAAAIGYVMGPLLGGFLSDNHLLPIFSFAFPFYLASLLSLIAFFLAIYKLKENKRHANLTVTIWQRFNFIKRLNTLFKSNFTLKYLLLVSTIYTFSVDIFYEFGPVYLTGLWAMSPAGIALYNAILCISLSIGAGWLPRYLAKLLVMEYIITITMFVTALVFALMVIFPSTILAFCLFGLVGLNIATVNTNLTILVSNSADELIQGEALGAQMSLRTLGDAIICLLGGFLIISSVILPLMLSSLFALLAVIVYVLKFAVTHRARTS